MKTRDATHSLRTLLLAASMALPGAASAATLIVTSAADTGGSTCSTTCTLRQAINAANAVVGADTINFAIPDPVKGEILISPTTVLPNLNSPMTINGYSQPLSTANTLASGSNARPRIRIDGGALAGSDNGLQILSSNVVLRGLSITGFKGNLIGTGNGPYTGIVIAGNFIGLATNGTTTSGSVNGAGVLIGNAVATIGGSAPADRNVISGNVTSGIVLNTGTNGSLVQNNLIGTDKSGTLARPNGGQGVAVGSTSSVVVGTLTAPNVIAHNNSRGIGVAPGAGTGNTLYANRIYANAALGIDLGNDGVTPNDGNDGDPGANGLQNFPILTAASRIDGGLSVSGTLDVGNSAVTATFLIAFYASSACDALGHGEGERFLGVQGKQFISPNGEGFTLNVSTSDPLPTGTVITATATSTSGNTSEFSPCFELDPPPLVVTSTADTGGTTCGATCTLRQAIGAANARAVGVSSTIRFALDGDGPFTISPASPLPTFDRPVFIDGYSQPGASPNTLAVGDDAVIKIRIDGNSAGANTIGFGTCADDMVIRGVSITRFASGIAIGATTAGATCPNAKRAVIAGNFIGLQPDGAPAGNSQQGVFVNTGQDSVIGGVAAADRNVISANGSSGVFVQNQATGRRIDNNYIGTDPTGLVSRGNSGPGVQLGTGTSQVKVGELAPNRIASNNQGIRLTTAALEGNSLYANEFRSNSGLGIDLGTVGVTPNDNAEEDADTGPNRLQNFPILSQAERSDAGIRVSGQLFTVRPAVANAPYTVAVYASDTCDGTGHGEGDRYLGASVVFVGFDTVDFSFDLATDDPLGAGTQITTTATDTSGNTSEFSLCIAATDAPPGLAVTSTADTDGGTCGATCTLRQAINVANQQPGADTIRFALQGTGPFTIAPLTSLPTITDAVTIDGYRQLGSSANTDPIQSNAVLLVQLNGTTTSGPAAGFSICAPDVTVRGLSITGFNQQGVRVGAASDNSPCSAPNAVIAGNFIGLDADGTTLRGNVQGGIVVTDAARIGGSSPADRNVVGGAIAFGGIAVNGTVGVAQIDGNLIGTDRTGSLDRGNAPAGLFINGPTRVVAGALAPNRLSFNAVGALVASGRFNNELYANEYVANDALGIDLSTTASANGVTPNDPNDDDIGGGNNLQNFPELTGLEATTDSLVVSGTLDVPASTTNASYRIAVYESAACDGTNGEGEIYLGSQLVALSGSPASAQSFSVTIAGTPPAAGRSITATATDPLGNTSEFSVCIAAPPIELVFKDGYE